MLRVIEIIAVFCIVCFTGIVGSNAASVQWPVSAGGNGHWYEAVLADTPVSVAGPQFIEGVWVTGYSGGITWTAAKDASMAGW
ncbi:MAG: hypothetical protein IT426_05845 [Pirellulales bacterium]|nr:hypothetical protein [Pirellulales bacterium]